MCVAASGREPGLATQAINRGMSLEAIAAMLATAAWT
jgi:hypothetical protein